MNRFNLTSDDSPFGRPSGHAFGGAFSSGRGASRLPEAAPEASPAPAEQGVRWDLIRRLRREIAAGTYASPERWQDAVRGLADDVAG